MDKCDNFMDKNLWQKIVFFLFKKSRIRNWICFRSWIRFRIWNADIPDPEQSHSYHWVQPFVLTCFTDSALCAVVKLMYDCIRVICAIFFVCFLCSKFPVGNFLQEKSLLFNKIIQVLTTFRWFPMFTAFSLSNTFTWSAFSYNVDQWGFFSFPIKFFLQCL